MAAWEPGSRGDARWQRPLEALLFIALLTLYGYFIQAPAANGLSRYDLVLAVAEQGTFSIDAYHENTIDKGYHAGHFYSDKPIGVSLLSLPVYVGLRGLLKLGGLWPLNEQYVVYLLNLVVVALPSALLVVLIYRIVAWLSRSGGAALLAALAYGVGTLALPFATLYFGHQTSAFFGFAAFYVLLGAAPRKPSGRRAFAAGALGGLAVVTEYALVIVVALLALYLLWQWRSLRYVTLYVLGGLPLAVLLGLYNYASFGSPFSLTYEHVYLSEFAGMHQGLFGLTIPNGWVLLDLLFSGKGLLTNSPVLALAPLGAWALWRTKRWRREALLIVGIVGLFLAYNAAYYLPFGGSTPGPRFLVPMLPFAAVALGMAVGRWRWAFLLAVPLTLISAAVMLAATATVPLLGDEAAPAFLAQWLPALREGRLALNQGTLRFGLLGTASLVPLAALLTALALAAQLVSRLTLPRRLAYVPLAAHGLLLLALLWPTALPGLPYGAVALPAGDPVIVVHSVRTLPPVDGRRTVEVTVSSVGSLAANVGLFFEAVDATGQGRERSWHWPVNLLADRPVRFTLSWDDAPAVGPGLRWLTVRVMHSSLAYSLAEVRAPLTPIVGDGSSQVEQYGGQPTYN